MMEKKTAVAKMNAVQRLAAVGGNEPVKAVAVGHPLQQLAGGHKGGIHRHHQGETGQGCHRHPERHPIEHGGVMSDQISFVGLKINGADNTRMVTRGVTTPDGQGQEDVGLADLPPGADQPGGLDDRFHPGIGQDAEGDTGDRSGRSPVSMDPVLTCLMELCTAWPICPTAQASTC